MTVDDNDRIRYTRANREAWNEAAPVHRKRNQAQLLKDFSEPGFNDLPQHCVERLLEIGVVGKSVAQICCNNGRDLLSVKNMGAGHCVGFDAAESFLEQARELAQAAGHSDIDFVATDIYDISPDYHDRFDVVMITVGVLGWMPDLQGFFHVAASLLKPGGYMFIEEMHPVLFMYEEGEGNSPAYLAYSYFKEEPWIETAGLDYYGRTKYESKPNYSFPHTLSEIVMSAIGSGLSLEHFAELGYDISFFCSDLEHAQAKPPMGMTLVWRKDLLEA